MGLDWDQGRTGKILRNCGPGVQGDIQEISRRVQKFVDIPREFARGALRREELAREAEKAGHFVDAREHYYIAATFYTNAMWESLRRRQREAHRLGRTKTGLLR